MCGTEPVASWGIRALRLDLEHAVVGHRRASFLDIASQKSVLPKRRHFTEPIFIEKDVLLSLSHLLEVSR